MSFTNHIQQSLIESARGGCFIVRAQEGVEAGAEGGFAGAGEVEEGVAFLRRGDFHRLREDFLFAVGLLVRIHGFYPVMRDAG